MNDSDDYDPISDVWGSVAYAYQVIRERKRNGGAGWIPSMSYQRKETLAEGVTLYLGDCRDILPGLGKVDAVVITDPPYGVEFRGNGWDREVPEIAVALPTMFDRVVIIMGTVASWQFPEPKWVACWARPASSSRSKVGGFSHWSPILLYGNVEMSVDFRSWHAIANAYPPGFEHPSPKPVCVMRWLVRECSKEGEIVIDPFCGSGTTGVAAAQLGRRFIGIEKEPRYFDLSCRRISKALSEPDLFIESPPPVPKQEKLSL